MIRHLLPFLFWATVSVVVSLVVSAVTFEATHPGSLQHALGRIRPTPDAEDADPTAQLD